MMLCRLRYDTVRYDTTSGMLAEVVMRCALISRIQGALQMHISYHISDLSIAENALKSLTLPLTKLNIIGWSTH